jgi:prepilin-type N-terminal cleavage/methylation domain-containing protein/prepilin-type processing-associated H-X9-DG protein
MAVMKKNANLAVAARDAGKPRPVRAGFSLVELLVVIGIIAMLVGILLPALSRARDRSNCTVCASNLQQIGYCLQMYANENGGWLFPVGPMTLPNPDYPLYSSQQFVPQTLGTNMTDPTLRWPVYVFQPAIYDPPIMLCPSDFDPADQHSYVVNQHLADHAITSNDAWSTQGLGGLYSSQIVVMGEKVTDQPDYYMEVSDFNRVVEPYRHGIAYGSNYLYLDWHVTTDAPSEALSGTDPWDPPIISTSAGSGAGNG